MRTNRTERLPRVVCMAAAILLFPFIAVCAGCVVLGHLSALAGFMSLETLSFPYSELIAVGLLIVAPILVAVPVTRGIYHGLRWKLIEGEFGFCSRCGYDLTGNVSGVCPECGTGVQ